MGEISPFCPGLVHGQLAAPGTRFFSLPIAISPNAGCRLPDPDDPAKEIATNGAFVSLP